LTAFSQKILTDEEVGGATISGARLHQVLASLDGSVDGSMSRADLTRELFSQEADMSVYKNTKRYEREELEERQTRRGRRRAGTFLTKFRTQG
jgi:hypothetical protein